MLAYGYALDLKDDWIASGGSAGANIVSVNSSFGIDFANCNSSTYAPWNDMFDLMGQSGILSIAATMNNPSNVDAQGDVPTGCSSDYLITVTATDDRDRRTFSAYGATTIDLGAPGEDVYSTLNGSGYGSLSGTSMATPQVTGAVAVLHSVGGPSFAALRASDPAAAALEIKNSLLSTVDVVPTLEASPSREAACVRAAAAIVALGGSAVSYCTLTRATPPARRVAQRRGQLRRGARRPDDPRRPAAGAGDPLPRQPGPGLHREPGRELREPLPGGQVAASTPRWPSSTPAVARPWTCRSRPAGGRGAGRRAAGRDLELPGLAPGSVLRLAGLELHRRSSVTFD